MTTNSDEMDKAVHLLREGKLVAFPTETVYGLGADASNDEAVRKVFTLKERPDNHPLIVHIARLEQLQDWAVDVPPEAMKLADAFWPGPLTLVLKKKPEVSSLLTGGQATIGIRIPRHPLAQGLLDAFGDGLAAPSANKFTHISPTTASAVYEDLGTAVDMIMDGGPCEVGLESTIIDLSGDEPVLLRPGMLSQQAIEEVLGKPLHLAADVSTASRAPGSHLLHYAPKTKTHLIATGDITNYIQSLQSDGLPVVCVAYSDTSFPQVKQVDWVNMPADAAAYAHDIYRTLRALDTEHYKEILIEAVPETDEWTAIRDRLQKATGSST